jgi:hypothetical protein
MNLTVVPALVGRGGDGRRGLADQGEALRAEHGFGDLRLHGPRAQRSLTAYVPAANDPEETRRELEKTARYDRSSGCYVIKKGAVKNALKRNQTTGI